MLGLAAIGSEEFVRQFGDVVRQEYRAVGIRMGLSTQADLATEPRWPRVTATFGEDAALARRLVEAYVEGFQHGGDGLRQDSVIMVVKHFAGYGAAKVAAVMPTYSIFEDLQVNGVAIEQVGGGFNRWLLHDLLREREGFNGVIVSDWAITQDCQTVCLEGVPAGQAPTFANFSTGWGVQAGIDQFGGTEEGNYIVDAAAQGLVTEERINESVLRVLTQKFQLGLFENPYVAPAAAGALMGNAEFLAQGEVAQRRSLVLLENRNNVLPLIAQGQKVFLRGIAAAVVSKAGFTVVDDIDDADFALIRAEAPHQMLHPGYPFGAIQHEGDLDFKTDDPTLRVIQSAAAKKPTIVTVMLDRPAILTPLQPLVAAMLGDFGISDAALLDVITGKATPEGNLPFELPSSMDAVRAQLPDVPYDSQSPLYNFGYGLRYP